MNTAQVELAGEHWKAQPGQCLTMGRTGDVIIDDNLYLNRIFLVLFFADGFWWLANVGSRAHATLTGGSGLTTSQLGPGSRMPLVFAQTVVTFSAGPFNYEINLFIDEPILHTVGAPRTLDSADTNAGGTVFTEGQLLAILAVAEPMLKGSGVGLWAVPTAVQAAKRLGWTQTKFNRKLDNVCDKLDRAGVMGLKGARHEQALGRRARLAEYAVNSRIVTSHDLPMLDAEWGRGRHPVAAAI
ncbi:hypothetical protein SAMN02745244_03388 [Tessaracoccus bendigoensis DSM 12906]|uniref:Uncharacterized protein n=1 Tax=Tessaracoccus bendigoensis DSM 12906 TaxID=1123357 RepID=A0A1M6MKN7_9ACTN|nr:hypothetical protein [Tessaracoccus bendigoensis]SHJ84041.1 hypothetical protein SAMN02745244_03388 [Tessaracoccus bendigoensis DSM 12906]